MKALRQKLHNTTSAKDAVSGQECWRDEEELRTTVESWAARIGVQQPTVEIRPMPKRWGMMQLEHIVMSLAAELLTMPKFLGEYVIIHELLHLLVPQAGHGRLFKLFLVCYMPDWQERERALQSFVEKILC
jgi:predicted metal-dependent hydrolase